MGPVKSTAETFKSIRNKAQDSFPEGNQKSAFALVHQGGDAKAAIGIRIECTDLSKEFVSSVSFGRDPEGQLYYQDISKLTGECRYEIEFKVGSVLSIKMFPYGSKTTDPIAQFVGPDPASAISWLSFSELQSGLELKGRWLDYTPLPIPGARVTCRQNDTTVTIILQSVGKKVTFNLPTASRVPLNVVGTLTLNGDLDTVKPGTKTCVDYNSDRILFYPQMGSTKMTGYFFPQVVKNADLYSLAGTPFITNGPTAEWS